MSGRPKRGIEFAGWDVDIFENDTKIDELLDAQGWIGFSIYFYLCQRAYASDGYFYRWSYANAATTARRMGGGIGSEAVKQAVAVCLQIGLFDKRLFDLGGVLTSKGIQRRYVEAIQKRSNKTVIKEYWLLDPGESKGVTLIHQNTDVLSEDSHSLSQDSHSLPGNSPKVKESKVKEKKSSSAAVLRRTDAERMIDEMNFDAALTEAAKDWLTYKIEKRQGYKPTGFKSLLKQIDTQSKTHGSAAVVSVIRSSMSSNYQGIVWDKVRNSAGGKQVQRTNNRFNNFQGRDYDYEALERQLLDAQRRGGS